MAHSVSRQLGAGIVAGLAAIAAGCVLRSAAGGAPHAAQSGQVVTLDRIPDQSPERWWGLTNIFFGPVPDSLRSVTRFGEDWSAMEIADVVAGPGLQPIYAARFRAAGSHELRYVIDTAGSFDFTRAVALTFHRLRNILVADIPLDVRSVSGHRVRLPYQVLVSDDGYTYARIAEYRTGHVRVDGSEYLMKVRSRSRNRPFYGLGVGTVFLADLDGDGRIAEQAALTAGGRPAAAEEVIASAPFLLGGQALEISAIDSAGTRLVVRQSHQRVAAVEGFEAPELTGDLLDGGTFRLSQHIGTVTLIEFWSTECSFSERARPAVNAIAVSAANAPYWWVAVVREHDRAAITRHLAEHPRSGRVVLSDSATWAAYNPAGVTPLFVVVDQQGVVRYRGMGASAVEAVATKVRDLLGARLQPR